MILFCYIAQWVVNVNLLNILRCPIGTKCAQYCAPRGLTEFEFVSFDVEYIIVPAVFQFPYAAQMRWSDFI